MKHYVIQIEDDIFSKTRLLSLYIDTLLKLSLVKSLLFHFSVFFCHEDGLYFILYFKKINFGNQENLLFSPFLNPFVIKL